MVAVLEGNILRAKNTRGRWEKNAIFCDGVGGARTNWGWQKQQEQQHSWLRTDDEQGYRSSGHQTFSFPESFPGATWLLLLSLRGLFSLHTKAFSSLLQRKAFFLNLKAARDRQKQRKRKVYLVYSSCDRKSNFGMIKTCEQTHTHKHTKLCSPSNINPSSPLPQNCNSSAGVVPPPPHPPTVRKKFGQNKTGFGVCVGG